MVPPTATLDGHPDDLYEQAHATRERSRLLVAQLQATQRRAQENWQLIQAAWDHTERIRAQHLAASTAPDRLRRSAYARMQARLASMPVIEQAKGVIMAKYGWPEDQAFDALRRVSQRENIKVRDLAARIVAQTATPGNGSQARHRPDSRAVVSLRAGHTIPRSGRPAAAGTDG